MSKFKKTRLVSQIFFFLLVSLIAVNHYLVENGVPLPILGSSSLHSICPYGGVETFFALVSLDVFVKKIHMSSIVLTSIILMMHQLYRFRLRFVFSS